MHIKTITAARLVNTGNFENTRFEATAELADGETPSAAMALLQTWLTAVIDAEQRRRHPREEDRRWQRWCPELVAETPDDGGSDDS
jgi:hypothetical protein